MSDRNTIHDVLAYGPIMASDAELDILITANGAYLNVWCGNGEGGYSNTDCRALQADSGLYGYPTDKLIDRAELYLRTVVAGGDIINIDYNVYATNYRYLQPEGNQDAIIVRIDWSRPEAPVEYRVPHLDDEDDPWRATPYQTADFRKFDDETVWHRVNDEIGSG